MTSDGVVRVLIIEASALFHTLVAGALARFAGVQVAPGATAAQARDRILQYHPDVIIFDLGLPQPAGAQLLRDLRAHYPVPIIACSGSSRRDGDVALAAIELGALDVVVKPAGAGAAAVRQLGDELARRIRSAVAEARPVPPAERPAADTRLSFRAVGVNPARHLIVVGASTGGTEAVRELLMHAPADSPPMAIVQHMPALFTAAFARRLDGYSTLQVSEAAEGQPLVPGCAVVARGDTHLTVRRGGRGWYAQYTHQRRVNRHCPSVDELFDSAAKAALSNAVGILLTGMGDDGARGLLRLRQCGALTVAQDARTCVVFGMPKVAQQLGAAELTGAPRDIPRLIVQALSGRRRGANAAAGR